MGREGENEEEAEEEKEVLLGGEEGGGWEEEGGRWEEEDGGWEEEEDGRGGCFRGEVDGDLAFLASTLARAAEGMGEVWVDTVDVLAEVDRVLVTLDESATARAPV